MLFDTGYRKPICQFTVLDKSGVRLALLDGRTKGTPCVGLDQEVSSTYKTFFCF